MLIVDFHQYNVPQWFHDAAFMFDDYPRNGTRFFVGEYAVTSTNPDCALGAISCGRLTFPTLEGAAAEAAFMTGMERNSDVVFASACEWIRAIYFLNGSLIAIAACRCSFVATFE